MDKLSKEHRSWNMSRIKSKGTVPEIYVRSLLHRAGYRFRLHVKELPGKPDIVLPKYRTVIEVRGCFWHLHSNCSEARIPQTQTDWWGKKLLGNVQRDKEHITSLNALGWKVFVIWECILQMKENETTIEKYILANLKSFLESQDKFQEISK